METDNSELILDDLQVRQKIKRIAFEIYENNYDEQELVLAGIYDRGFSLAKLLNAELAIIAQELTVTLVCITLDKSTPLSFGIELNTPLESLEDKVVMIVDDVLNSGQAMAYGLKTLLNVNVKKIETAVLVNRSHKRYPISANYKGYELATTINDHVSVSLEEPFSVHLV